MFYRNTYSEINLNAFEHNVQMLADHTKKKVFCVCKANGYSHGDYPIAQSAFEQGCPYICVSSLDEAISLRRQSFSGDILILGYVDVSDIVVAIKHKITVSAISKEWVDQLVKLDIDLSTLVVHLKIDTGMNRLGMKKLDEVLTAMMQLQERKINIEGIFTHFHSADDVDKHSCELQMRWFYSIVDQTKYSFKWIHTSNSDASLTLEDSHSNAVRVGLALYGIKSVESSLDLHPVLSLYTGISLVKAVNKGEKVGYGATYTCHKDMFVATLPIGYGDGFMRKNQGRFLCVGDTPYEIIGRVCMDQCMIALDQAYSVGTVVEIIGEHIPLVKMAKELEMIPYEVLCLLNDRITKIVKRDGKVISSIHSRLPEETKEIKEGNHEIIF